MYKFAHVSRQIRLFVICSANLHCHAYGLTKHDEVETDLYSYSYHQLILMPRTILCIPDFDVINQSTIESAALVYKIEYLQLRDTTTILLALLSWSAQVPILPCVCCRQRRARDDMTASSEILFHLHCSTDCLIGEVCMQGSCVGQIISLTWDYWQCSYIGRIYLRYSHTMGIPPFDSILSSSALQLAIHALGYTLGSQSIGARLSGVIHEYSRLVLWSRFLLGATSCSREHNQDDQSTSSQVDVLHNVFLALVWHMHTLSDPRVVSP